MAACPSFKVLYLLGRGQLLLLPRGGGGGGKTTPEDQQRLLFLDGGCKVEYKGELGEEE